MGHSLGAVARVIPLLATDPGDYHPEREGFEYSREDILPLHALLHLVEIGPRVDAEEFHPDKIILFGSYAYGTPNQDSDVDLLVVMPARNQHDQAVRIRWRLAAPFPVDLIVSTPKQMTWRLKEGESFTTEIVSKGKLLYWASANAVARSSSPSVRYSAGGPVSAWSNACAALAVSSSPCCHRATS